MVRVRGIVMEMVRGESRGKGDVNGGDEGDGDDQGKVAGECW